MLRNATRTDRPEVESVLTSLKLPIAGIGDWLEGFWLAEHDGTIVGLAGIELYSDGALLRSVGVLPGWQGSGVGKIVVNQALDSARRAGCREVFLLTTTAERYFPRLGFTPISREQVPPGVQQSVEFRGACPASAVVMRRVLTQ